LGSLAWGLYLSNFGFGTFVFGALDLETFALEAFSGSTCLSWRCGLEAASIGTVAGLPAGLLGIFLSFSLNPCFRHSKSMFWDQHKVHMRATNKP
jgi:sterol desaturase/sphingolipid hydroxylase (fatty acid hydroxylase superfamily)